MSGPIPIPSPHPDVFDHDSVTCNEARMARAGFSAIPDLGVIRFWFGSGHFHARVTYGGHAQDLRHPAISGLVDAALRVRATFAPVTEPTSAYAKEAA